jgi:hypothetical protein
MAKLTLPENGVLVSWKLLTPEMGFFSYTKLSARRGQGYANVKELFARHCMLFPM